MPTTVLKTSAAPTQPSQGAQSARERAIAILQSGNKQSSSGNAQAEAVANPSSVSVEELSAVKSFSSESSESSSEGQTSNDESVESTKASEATTDEKPPLSAQYAQLARKEKALRAQMQKLKAEQDAFKREQEAANRVQTQPATPAAVDPNKFIDKQKLAEDPWAVLNDIGISYDQLTQQALNQPSAESLELRREIKALKSELQGIKGESENTKKSFEENQKKTYEQTLNQLRYETKQLVSADPAYEAIQASGAVEDVVELIKRTFEEEGRLLSVEEAARDVEEYLVEEAIKFAKLNKIQQRLKTPSPQPASQKQEQAKQQQQGVKTLTNSVGVSRQLTAKERAILAFKGELKTG